LLKVALNTKNQSINIIQWKGRYLSIRLFNKKIYLWYSFLIVTWTLPPSPPLQLSRRGCDRMVGAFTTTYAIGAFINTAVISKLSNLYLLVGIKS
jgi:hypothetical protein